VFNRMFRECVEDGVCFIGIGMFIFIDGLLI
jgi:hypothetical protein